MADEYVRNVRPGVDYSKISKSLAGKWVVVRRNDQQPLGAGDTLQEAFADADVPESSKDVVVTRVPTGAVVFET